MARAPDREWEQQQEGRSRHVQVWDSEGLPFSADYPQPVRLLRAEEQLTAAHYRDGEPTAETTSHHWVWITTPDRTTFPTHGFPYACKHRPNRLTPSGQREPVPGRGLAAVSLIR